MGLFLAPSIEILKRAFRVLLEPSKDEVKEAEGMTRGLGNEDFWAKLRRKKPSRVYRDISRDRESTCNLGKFTLRYCRTREEHLCVYETTTCHLSL